MGVKNDGFLYVEALFAIGIMLAVFTAAAVFGSKVFVNAAVEYEAAKLIGDLRYVQEISRSSLYPRDKIFNSIKPKKSGHFTVKVYKNKYVISHSVMGVYKETTHRAVLNTTYSPTTNFSGLYGGIYFLRNGDVKTIGTVRIESKFAGVKAKRYVIIDKSGRIRMDRTPP